MIMWFFCFMRRYSFDGLIVRFLAFAYIGAVIHFVHNNREGLTVRFALTYIGVVIHFVHNNPNKKER